LLTACGGGGGSGGSGTAPLTGSVSQGAPIEGATIKLIDAAGNTLDAGTSSADGSYAVADISALKAPILVVATANVAGAPVNYYSIITTKPSGSTVANVTPLTDAIVMQAAGKSLTYVADAPSDELPLITQSAVADLSSKFVTALADILEQIEPGASNTFNPITSSFIADGESAADKINDLVKAMVSITDSGVQTDLIDKSGSSGRVTVDGSAQTKLPAIPTSIIGIKPSKLTALIAALNEAIRTNSNLQSNKLAVLIDDNFLGDGQNKAETIQFFRAKASFLVGNKFVNPRLSACNQDLVCSLSLTLVGNGIAITEIDFPVQYNTNTQKFLFIGNRHAFKAKVESSLDKTIDTQGNITYASRLQFQIKSSSANTSYYKSAKAKLIDKNGQVDHEYQFRLNTASCDPDGSMYDGLPLIDPNNASNCATWDQRNSNNQALFKSINNKIKQGGYKVVFEAWTDLNMTAGRAEVTLPISEFILTTDSMNDSGYPKVIFNSGNSNTLPYLSIPNASDYVITGTLCISSANTCDKRALLPHTTAYLDESGFLPKQIKALAADGWSYGEQPVSYFIHVKDKAGRDMTVSKH
jgi:hypothetical protein